MSPVTAEHYVILSGRTRGSVVKAEDSCMLALSLLSSAFLPSLETCRQAFHMQVEVQMMSVLGQTSHLSSLGLELKFTLTVAGNTMEIIFHYGSLNCSSK